MKRMISVLLLSGFFAGFSYSTCAQVRVMQSNTKKKHKKHRKHYKNKSSQSRKKPVSAKLKAVSYYEKNKDLDKIFYKKWSDSNRLKYEDFKFNRNLYDKFLPSKDTDLTEVIYPDYREFYKELAKRIIEHNSENELFWAEKVERVFAERSDASDSSELSPLYEEQSYSIIIDSPAASLITIDPIIFRQDDDEYYYNITPVFSKQESWMIAKSSDILQHEQIHFDIFELYARRMRRYLMAVLKKGYSHGITEQLTNDITPAFEKLYQQLNALQTEFDRQTGLITEENGSLVALNKKWELFLKSKIDELAAYGTPEGVITLE